jgi:hypothetical protein
LTVEVLGVGRAAAVAAPEDLAAHADSKDHFRGDLIEDPLLIGEGTNDLEVFCQRSAKDSGAVNCSVWGEV